MSRRSLLGFLIATLSILLSSCEVSDEHRIRLKDATELGFEKSLIVDLGRLLLIDYRMFNNNASDANPVYPDASNFPEDTSLLTRYTPIANLQGRDNPQSMRKELYGHLWRANDSDKTLIISIRGTSDRQEWIDDAKFSLVPYSNKAAHGKVELGFSQIFTSLTISSPDTQSSISLGQYLSELKNIDTIITVGHSLGSSLATLTAFSATHFTNDITIRSLTFASPLTGDPIFVKAYQAGVPNSIRIVNHPDIVPRVPLPEFGYEHVWYELEISSAERLDIVNSIACYHSLNTYLHLLDNRVALKASCKKEF